MVANIDYYNSFDFDICVVIVIGLGIDIWLDKD